MVGAFFYLVLALFSLSEGEVSPLNVSPLLLQTAERVSPCCGFLVVSGDFPAASNILEELNVQN